MGSVKLEGGAEFAETIEADRPRQHPGDGPHRAHPAVGAQDGRLRGAGPRRGAGQRHLPGRPARSRTRAATRSCSRASPWSWRGRSPRALSIPTIGIGAGVALRRTGAGLLRPARPQPRLQAEVRQALRGPLRRARAARPRRSSPRCAPRPSRTRTTPSSRRPSAWWRATPRRRRLRVAQGERAGRAPSTECRSDFRRCDASAGAHHRPRGLPHSAEAARRQGRRLGPRADHGLPPPGPPEPHGGSARPGRRGGGHHLRQPHPVRPDRGPGRATRGTLEGDLAKCASRRRATRSFTPEAGGDVPGRLPDVRRGRRASQRPVRRPAAGALPRRGHGGDEALRAAPSPRGGVRGEGLPAAAGDPAAGAWTSTSAWRWWGCPSCARRTAWP